MNRPDSNPDDRTPREASDTDRTDRDGEKIERVPRGDNVVQDTPNPPYTTTGKITSPKFGSAGSGGLENEPGPERD